MTRFACFFTVFLAATFSGEIAASAEPIQLVNTRQVPVNAAGAEPALQTLVDAALGGGLDVDTSQLAQAVWAAPDWTAGILASLEFEYAGNNPINGFGMWSGTDTEAIDRVAVFLGGAAGDGSGGATQATITWDEPGTSMTVNGDCSKVNCGTFADIDPLAFGFYLQVGQGAIYYTADHLNGGLARALAFAADESMWAVGFEDFKDGDFNDGLISIHRQQGGNRVPPPGVPEPALMLLIGSGVGALLVRRRT